MEANGPTVELQTVTADKLCGLLHKFSCVVRRGMDNVSKAQDTREDRAVNNIFKMVCSRKATVEEINRCYPWCVR